MPDIVRAQRVESHLSLVAAIARSVHRRLPSAFDYEDLRQAGTIGLVKAVDDYDGRVPFVLFARFRIRGAILDSIRGKPYWESNNEAMEADVCDQAAGPEQLAADGELREQLDAALVTLSAAERRYLRARYTDGLSQAEAGASVGLGSKQAAFRLERGLLERLRKRMAS